MASDRGNVLKYPAVGRRIVQDGDVLPLAYQWCFLALRWVFALCFSPPSFCFCVSFGGRRGFPPPSAAFVVARRLCVDALCLVFFIVLFVVQRPVAHQTDR